MTASNRYWLYGGDRQPDGQSKHQLLGRFRTVANAKAAGRFTQQKNPTVKWWHVVDIRRDKIVAEGETKS